MREKKNKCGRCVWSDWVAVNDYQNSRNTTAFDLHTFIWINKSFTVCMCTWCTHRATVACRLKLMQNVHTINWPTQCQHRAHTHIHFCQGFKFIRWTSIGPLWLCEYVLMNAHSTQHIVYHAYIRPSVKFIRILIECDICAADILACTANSEHRAPCTLWPVLD